MPKLTPDFIKGFLIGLVITILAFLAYQKMYMKPMTPDNADCSIVTMESLCRSTNGCSWSPETTNGGTTIPGRCVPNLY